jgi:type I restriction enzyme S subunit
MTYVDNYLFDGESVGIGRKGTIDKPVLLKDKFWTVDTLFYTHSFNKITPYFVYIVFQSIKWRGYSEATGVPSLSKNIIEPINIPLPTLDEQVKISNILSSIDSKLEVLSEKKTYYQELKQGLMQQLLTGKIRVKTN